MVLRAFEISPNLFVSLSPSTVRQSSNLPSFYSTPWLTSVSLSLFFTHFPFPPISPTSFPFSNYQNSINMSLLFSLFPVKRNIHPLNVNLGAFLTFLVWIQFIIVARQLPFFACFLLSYSPTPDNHDHSVLHLHRLAASQTSALQHHRSALQSH